MIGSICELANDLVQITANHALAVLHYSVSVSQSAHPFDSPNITRDFCENQTEFVTDVFDSPEGAAGHPPHLRAFEHNLQKTMRIFG